MIIREILTLKGGETYSTTPEKHVTEAIQQMVERNIGSLIVLDEAIEVSPDDALLLLFAAKTCVNHLCSRYGRWAISCLYENTPKYFHRYFAKKL